MKKTSYLDKIGGISLKTEDEKDDHGNPIEGLRLLKKKKKKKKKKRSASH